MLVSGEFRVSMGREGCKVWVGGVVVVSVEGGFWVLWFVVIVEG